jgi:hypothetical protein
MSASTLPLLLFERQPVTCSLDFLQNECEIFVLRGEGLTSSAARAPCGQEEISPGPPSKIVFCDGGNRRDWFPRGPGARGGI